MYFNFMYYYLQHLNLNCASIEKLVLLQQRSTQQKYHLVNIEEGLLSLTGNMIIEK